MTNFDDKNLSVSVVFAVFAALSYGIGDYCGARASKSAPSILVTLVGQVCSLAMLVVVLAAFADPVGPGGDWTWGAVGGLGGFAGLAIFYYALSRGAMTVVAPLTAVVSAVLPVIAGLAVGERPSLVAGLGIVVAVAGIALVTGAVGSPHAPTAPRILVLAALAGCGFGWMFVCLDRTSSEAGMWPLLAARLATISLAAVVWVARRGSFGGAKLTPLAFVSGLFDMGANVFFVLANDRGLLSLVSVVTSLYPVTTIVLAMRLDRERATRWQYGGMGLAVTALVLVSLGS